jgi:hypothetical protein
MNQSWKTIERGEVLARSKIMTTGTGGSCLYFVLAKFEGAGKKFHSRNRILE